MVGNDIIDIYETKLSTNWKRKGFVQKVFNTGEQKIINNSSSPFITIWRMWSMKESAYKLYLQMSKKRFFNPSKIDCKILSWEKGYACIDGLHMSTNTIINSKYIFTSAYLPYFDDIESTIFYLTKSNSIFQSMYTHQKIIEYIAKTKGLIKAQLEIKKHENKTPALYYNGQNLNISFSLSHHGNYGVFSILNN